MSAGSKSSKPDPGEADPSLGFVPLQEITNVWTDRMRQLDVELWPKNGRTPGREEMIEFMATLKLELFRRARTNYVEYCRRVPDPALARAKTAPKEEPADGAHEKRLAKLSKYY